MGCASHLPQLDAYLPLRAGVVEVDLVQRLAAVKHHAVAVAIPVPEARGDLDDSLRRRIRPSS